jgi:cytochrome b6
MEKAQQFLVERLGLGGIIEIAKHKTVPLHRHSYWYYWGGISLFCFIVQVFTGILLMLYYRPGPEAHESVRQLTYELHFGWLIRSVHIWSASLFLFSVFVHMFSVFFMKAYRAPREFSWFTGLGLLGLGMVFGFSGYLLPMDDLAYFATKVGLEMPKIIPVVGTQLSYLALGGVEVSEITVQRFFALHSVILPMLFLPLLGLHLWLVQTHGSAVPPSEEEKPEPERKSIPFFPNFMAKDLAMWLITLNVIAVLAALFPGQLGEPADSLKSAPIGIHPEWYFMSQFQTLKVLGRILPGSIGEIAGMFLFTAGLVLWLLVPFFDVREKAALRARNTTYFGILVIVGLIVMTVWGYLGVR